MWHHAPQISLEKIISVFFSSQDINFPFISGFETMIDFIPPLSRQQWVSCFISTFHFVTGLIYDATKL